jgi:hypothetical protein
MKVVSLIECGVWGSNILRDLIRLNCRVYVVVMTPAPEQKPVPMAR